MQARRCGRFIALSISSMSGSRVHHPVRLLGARPGTAEEVVAVVTGDRMVLFSDLTFTARIERDLRGQWIHGLSTTTYVYNLDDFVRGTSELSVALLVE